MRGLKSLILAVMVVSTVLIGGAGNVAAAGDMTVNVTNQNGTSVANASVVVIDQADGSQVASGTTDSTGSITFASVPDGTFDVEVTSPSGENTVVKTKSISGAAVTVNATVTTVGNAELTLSHVGTSESEKGVEVELQDSNGNVVNTKTTDSEGRVLFSNVNSGSYTFNIAPADTDYVNKTVSASVPVNDTVYKSDTVTPYHKITFAFYDPAGDTETAGFVDHLDSTGSLVTTYYADEGGVATTQKIPYGTQVTFEVADERSEYKTASMDLTVEADATYNVNFESTDSDATTSIQLNDSTGDSGGGSGSTSSLPTGVLLVAGFMFLVIIGFAAVRN